MITQSNILKIHTDNNGIEVDVEFDEKTQKLRNFRIGYRDSVGRSITFDGHLETVEGLINLAKGLSEVVQAINNGHNVLHS